jgi:hypothetical protein
MKKAASSTPCVAIMASRGLHAYIDTAGITEDRKSWLFRTARDPDGCVLSDKPMSGPDAWRMIRRRAAAAGIAAEIGCYTFLATGITAYLANGGALEHVQEMACTRARAPPSSMIGRRSGLRRMKLKESGCEVLEPAKARTPSNLTPRIAERADELYEGQSRGVDHAVQDWER